MMAKASVPLDDAFTGLEIPFHFNLDDPVERQVAIDLAHRLAAIRRAEPRLGPCDETTRTLIERLARKACEWETEECECPCSPDGCVTEAPRVTLRTRPIVAATNTPSCVSCTARALLGKANMLESQTLEEMWTMQG